jgi:hypothetical protein
MEGLNPTKKYFKHICKYHNVSPLCSYYMLKKLFLKRKEKDIAENVTGIIKVDNTE